MNAGEGGVVGGEAAVVERNCVHAFLGHVLLGEDAGEFTGAVVAEIVEDDGISFLNCGNGLSVFGDHDGLDELIRDIGVVAGLDTGLGAFKSGALSFYKEVVGLFHAAPAFVTVHGVEAAADGCHLAGGFLHLLFKFGHKAKAAAGVCVTAVHEGVHVHFVKAFFLCHAKELVHVVKGAVNAAVGCKAHEVELLAAFFHILEGSLYLLVLQEFVLTARDVYLYKVLVHHAAGAKVHVADLGVAHLAVREAYIFTAGLKVAGGIFGTDGVDIGGAFGPDCV